VGGKGGTEIFAEFHWSLLVLQINLRVFQIFELGDSCVKVMMMLKLEWQAPDPRF
jgi:hypothetical protein